MRCDLFTDLIIITNQYITDEVARTNYFVEVLEALKQAKLLGLLNDTLLGLDVAFASAYAQIK